MLVFMLVDMDSRSQGNRRCNSISYTIGIEALSHDYLASTFLAYCNPELLRMQLSSPILTPSLAAGQRN